MGESLKKDPDEIQCEKVESSDEPSALFRDICMQLDDEMDPDFLQKAWTQYSTVRKQCVLEGKESAWCASAIYLSMWQCSPVQRESLKKYSLAELIRICKLSVIEFFEIASKWMDMVNSPRRLQDHVLRVQSSLAVAAVVYKKFLPIFRKIFAPPYDGDDCLKGITCKKLFHLTWTLFVVMRKQFTEQDLMTSFHLLLCVIDFVFQDIRRSKLPHLLDADFVNSIDVNPGENSVLEKICKLFEGSVLDAKHYRAHYLMPKLIKLSEEKAIETTANLNHFVVNEFINKKKLDDLYEEMIIKKGEMDERMFLPDDISCVFDKAFDVYAVRRLQQSENDKSTVDTDMLLHMSTQNCLGRLQDQRQQKSSVSGRRYVISGEQYHPSAPISSSLYNASKLEELLQGDWTKLDAEVENVLVQSCQDPVANINDLVLQMSERLDEVVEDEVYSKGADYDASFNENLPVRKSNTETLFFRFLHKITLAEKDRLGGGSITKLSAVLLREDFLKALYVCSLQLVLFTFESVREFPWCLEIMKLSAIHFYKVIELIVRADACLSREMVKHLNRVEERVLEELSWSLDSPLWHSLHRRADGVPSSQAVSLETVEGYSMRQPTLSQRYNTSPVKPLGAKRRLDFDDDDSAFGTAKRRTADTEVLTIPSATTLFFRKVYYLAAIRLRDLCDRVRLDEKGRQRAWTLFEHVLRTETSLMAGRHLDQNLMCCLYVVAKIGQQNISFHDIMYHYRHQPQANSRVYRKVLVESSPPTTIALDENTSCDSVDSTTDDKFSSESVVVPPTTPSGTTTPEPHVEYTDLIKYYNRIFIARVESFVKKLQSGLIESGVTLIPIPKVQCNRLSPLKSVSDHVTVVPMPAVPYSPARPIRYGFHKATGKDLNSINVMMQNAGRAMSQLSGGFNQSPYRNASRTLP